MLIECNDTQMMATRWQWVDREEVVSTTAAEVGFVRDFIDLADGIQPSNYKYSSKSCHTN